MAQSDTQKPLPYLVRKTVIGGGATHAAVVAGRTIAQYSYNAITPLLAAAVDFAHIFPEILFGPMFMLAKGVSHAGLFAGKAGMSVAVGAAKITKDAMAYFPEGGKLKENLLKNLGWFIKRGEVLKTQLTQAHRWVRDTISPRALGIYVANGFKKAEMALFRFGSSRSPLAAGGIILGIVAVVAPITAFGGVLTHALSFGLLNNSIAGAAAFFGANAAATLLPKFKLFLAPLYMGCAMSLSNSDLGKKTLRWFDHVYRLNIIDDANRHFNGIHHALTKGNLNFMSIVAEPFPKRERLMQRIAVGVAVVAGVSVSPLFALGAAACIAAPIAVKIAKDKAAAFLAEKVYGDKHIHYTAGSEKIGNLVMHTIDTYTFSYYYKKDPALFKSAPQELLKFLIASDHAGEVSPEINNTVAPSALMSTPAARTSLLRDWTASAVNVAKRTWQALPKTLAELGHETRAVARSAGFYTMGFAVAAPATVAAGGITYVATHAPSSMIVGQPLQALLTSLTHHSGGHFAQSIGGLVAGALAIPGALAGLMGGSTVSRNLARCALFSKTSRETCLTSNTAKNAEARLISDGALTGLAAAGALFITGSLPIAAGIWGTSALISIVRNHEGMKEPHAARPTSTPTPLPVTAPQAA